MLSRSDLKRRNMKWKTATGKNKPDVGLGVRAQPAALIGSNCRTEMESGPPSHFRSGGRARKQVKAIDCLVRDGEASCHRLSGRILRIAGLGNLNSTGSGTDKKSVRLASDHCTGYLADAGRQ
jgi:hypothetical protein